MKKLFILPLVLFSTTILVAQNYNLFLPNIEYTYSELYGEIKAVRIDSIKPNGNELFYYNFKTPRDTSGEINNTSCVHPFSESWIGNFIELKQGGKALFFGRYGDTLYLKPFANIGETWLFGKLDAGSYIEAKIDSIVYSHFIGLTDSVKIIHLQAYDNAGNGIYHQINNITIRISKELGLISLMNFFDYPDCREFDLFGKTTPIAGKTNITNKEIYNFSVGDEFHSDFFRQNVGNGNTQEIRQIKTIIQKSFSINNDTVFYSSDICAVKKEVYHIAGFDSVVIIPYTDTIIELHIINKSIDDKIDKMPEETWFRSNQCTYLNLHYTEIYNQRLIKYYFGQLFSYDASTDCYHTPPADHLTRYEYIEGCGGPYYELASCGSVPLSYKLDYFKKGDEEWGTPYFCDDLLSSAKQVEANKPEVVVYPNPMADMAYVIIKNYNHKNLTFKLSNNLSQVILNIPINSSNTLISRKQLQSGLYFYTISNSSGNLSTGKLIVE